MYTEEIVELDDETDDVHEEKSFEIELCLERAPFVVYEAEKPPISKVEEVSLQKRELSPSMRLVGIKKGKTTTRIGGGEEDGCEQLKLKRWKKKRKQW